MKRNFITFFITFLFALTLLVDSPRATMVEKIPFDEVVRQAELIFEGKVLSKQTRPSPLNADPFTYFTFEVMEVIKGSYLEETIELGFMGGTQGDLVLKVRDMHMPEIGERGIYFVETLIMQQVHPLYGWHQGHYIVISNQPAGPDLVIPVKQDSNMNEIKALRRGITLEEFKNNIYNVLERGQ